MKNLHNAKRTFFIFSLLLMTVILAAESFRVSKVTVVNISDDSNSETTINAGINEAFAIYLPKDKTFIEGLEIKMSIPSAIAAWPDSVACTVYNNITPVPTENKIDYSGTRFYVSTLPGRLSWIVQIPLIQNNSIKSNKYTTKTDILSNPSNDVIFVRFQPIMKGVSTETYESKISIAVKPILIDKGYLNVDLKSPDKQLSPCTIFVDDNIVNEQNGKILLDTGIHNISIISDFYRNEVRTVRIDQAKTTDLSVDMKSIEPTLLIAAPDGTIVYLDNNPCSIIGKEFVISEGNHKIKFSVGNYEIVRTITATKGKTYTADFSIDLNITEE